MVQQITLMSPDRIERSLKRIALEVWEHLGEETSPLIIGLNERGLATAQVIASHVNALTGGNSELCRFDVEKNNFNGERPRIQQRRVLVVDDVIFSGKSMFSAITNITNQAEVEDLKVAVLVDRGHRKLPVEASYIGIEVPTKLAEHVDVIVEDNQLKEVILIEHT